ncbi:MAG TPA: hypothetical protein VFE90_09945 [Myxococcales bacterium]|nr:hypothetical protein [Myxococcales bacterium]
MRNLVLPLFLFLAACPEQVGQQCPPNTSVIGQYTLNRTPQHDAGECIATPADGGPPLKLTQDNPTALGATLCLATVDGGPQLNLVVPGKGGVRTSDLLPDGGFHFVSDQVVASGTACVCDVNVIETFDGFMLTGVADAGFSLQPDGGFPTVLSIAATLADNLTAAPSAQPCICALPCAVAYSINGTRF